MTGRHLRIVATTIAFLVLISLGNAGLATQFYVNGTTGDNSWDGLAPEWDGTHGPKATIQAGIDAALDGDTVNVADGTYTGDGNRGLFFRGKAITLRSENGPQHVTIDCEAGPGLQKKGVNFISGETDSSVLEGFTITGGYAFRGAGIYCRDSSPTIRNCTITGNYSRVGPDSLVGVGGGIFCHDSSPIITNCIITDNFAEDDGGGICCRGMSSPTIADCTITGNSALEEGGGIYFSDDANPTITGCIVSGNIAEEKGGGIYCENGTTTIRNCVITGNICADEGGGVVFYNVDEIALVNCIVGGNSCADRGGGILFCESTATVMNCTVAANSAGVYGGGAMFAWGSTGTMVNCKVWDNTANEGNQIGLRATNNPSTLSIDYCDVQGGLSEVYLMEGCTIDWGGANITVDPFLTEDWHLQTGSPCIDAGRSEGAPIDDIDGEQRPYGEGVDIGADEFIDSDLDGISDWAEININGTDPYNPDTDADGIPDGWEVKRGLDPLLPNGGEDPDEDGQSNYEEYLADTDPLHPDNPERTYYVNTATGSDSSDGLAPEWDGVHGPKATIQAGIDATMSGWDHTVLVADGIYRGDGNRDLFFQGKAITLRSKNGPEHVTIDCEAGPGLQKKGVNFVSNETNASILEGFRITGGYAFRGAGIYCHDSSPTIRNCVITGNYSRTGSVSPSGVGGGICCDGSNPIITDCTISGNTAESRGGGISCNNYSSPSIVNCVVTGNSAVGNGGGICLDEESTPIITNCTITGNSAEDGGGICHYEDWDPYSGEQDPMSEAPADWLPLVGSADIVKSFYSSNSGVPVVEGCTITDNTATGNGGGICCNRIVLTISDCTIAGNSAGQAGGGIYGDSSTILTISNCTIIENLATLGGGISHDRFAEITDCRINDNLADYGGGMHCLGVYYAVIENCALDGHYARYDGGGIYSIGTALVISNSMITGNSADSDGGGIFRTNGDSWTDTTITNCTIADNSAGGEGGSIRSVYSDFDITNCILWGNNPQEISTHSSTVILEYCDIQGGWPGQGNIDVDPMLTYDGHLKAMSPCIDWCPDGPSIDMDGETRPFPSGGLFDIGPDEFVDSDHDGLPDWWELDHFESTTGANPENDDDSDGLTNLLEYENGTDPVTWDTDGDGRNDSDELLQRTNPRHPDNVEKTYYVNADTGEDNYDGLASSWDGSHGPKETIQAGVDAAITGWDYKVLVADGIYKGEGNRDIRIIGKAITLQSENGPEYAIIDCENSGRGFHVCGALRPRAVIQGFTITNGSTSDSGGGIYCEWSNLTVNDCIIAANTSDGEGGGVCCNSSGDVALANCLITGNFSADRGGGVSSAESEMTIMNCTITGNSAINYGGGVMFSWGSEGRITNSILWSNSAPEGHEIALRNTANPSTAMVHYSDVQGGEPDVYVMDGCTLIWDPGNIDEDPLFVSGPGGDYYLSQVAAGQLVNSPCVDAGSDTAQSLGFNRSTTRTDHVRDTGIIDLGYHTYALGIDSVSKTGDDITIHWNAKPHLSYMIQLSTDLENWTSIPVGETDTWTDPNAHGYRHRFYRIREQ